MMHTDNEAISAEADKVEYLDGALVQHGPANDRVYLMKLGEAQPEQLVESLLKKATDSGYSKVFAKIPESADESFLDAGFEKEARVPGFFGGDEPASFLGFYLDSERKQEENPEKLDDILELTRHKKALESPPPLSGTAYSLRRCGENDVAEMAEIYRDVFPTYPFPIHDPGYLLETMRSHVDYFGVASENRLVALASAEIDYEAKNAEMTDFATLPDSRGNSLGTHLLGRMEQAVKSKTIKTAYTIARAASPGMNITFAKCGYEYGGRLINNTNISGQIESMNIWYKAL